MGKYVSRLRKVFTKQKEELMGLIEFIVAEAIEEATENAAKNTNFNRYGVQHVVQIKFRIHVHIWEFKTSMYLNRVYFNAMWIN